MVEILSIKKINPKESPYLTKMENLGGPTPTFEIKIMKCERLPVGGNTLKLYGLNDYHQK